MKNFDEVYEIRVAKRDPETGKVTLDSRGDPVTEAVLVKRNERPGKDRSFLIGGMKFTYRPSIAPESIARWSAMTGGEFDLKDEQGKPVLDDKGEKINTLTEAEALKIFDDTVLAYLEPGQESNWESVRNPNAEIPVNLTDLQALVQWLFEEQSGRPTSRPSGSSNGSPTTPTGTSLTAESPLPEETVSKA